MSLRMKAVLMALLVWRAPAVSAEPDPLPSWNEGPAKKAVLEFVRATTDKASPKFVPPGKRFATFDQDGTLWVEKPMYTQVQFAFDRVAALADKHPEWKTTEPFKSALAHDRKAMDRFTNKDMEKILAATHTGMTVEAYRAIAKDWLDKARDPRWKRPYTDLVYQPMLEVMRLLRSQGYKTYIVTGSGQDFVRIYADRAFGVPPEQVIGTAIKTKFVEGKDDRSDLLRTSVVLLNDNFSGKPEDIHLFLGRRPGAAFGNSTGDRQMLAYTQGGAGLRLMMLVLHDDGKREYAYGPARGLPASNVGTFTQGLYDEARKRGWVVISMKDDWKRIFPFDK